MQRKSIQLFGEVYVLVTEEIIGFDDFVDELGELLFDHLLKIDAAVDKRYIYRYDMRFLCFLLLYD